MVTFWSLNLHTNLSLPSQNNCPDSLVLSSPGDVLSELLHHVQGESISSLGIGKGNVLHISFSPYICESVSAKTSTENTTSEQTDTARDTLEHASLLHTDK